MAAATPIGGETAASNGLAVTSHKGRRQSRKSDPFLEVQDDAVKLSDQPSPNSDGGSSSKDSDGPRRSPSLLADLVLTPMIAIATILSLFLVDRQQRERRAKQHSSGAETSLWMRLAHWSWLDPEPYQERQDTTWKHSDASAAPDGSFQGWYVRKKHRAMAKLELDDALEMRGRVMIALVAWMLIGFAALAYTMRQLYAWASL